MGESVYNKYKTEREKLLFAASLDDLDALKGFLNQPENLQKEEVWPQQEAFWVATHYGNIKICEFLLSKREVDVEAKDVDGWTALFIAAQEGHCDLVEYFLDTVHVNIDTTDHQLWTPLHAAAYRGHSEIVEQLLSRGASIKSSRSGATPLYLAAQNGYSAIVEGIIVKDPSQINAATNYGSTSLYVAAHQGRYEIVDLLLSRGADVNITDMTRQGPLFVAAENGHSDIAVLLLQASAIVDQSNDFKRTPLHVAAENGYPRVVSLLLEHNANPHKVDHTGSSALHLASRLPIAQLESTLTDMIAMLVEKGCDINLKNREDQTPIELVSKSQILKTVMQDSSLRYRIRKAKAAQETQMNLSSHMISKIPPELRELNVVQLNLSSNQLKDINGIGFLSTLVRLDLSHNSITQLPPEIGQLKSLVFLDLSKNSLTELPKEIGSLSELSILNLSENKLTRLVDTINQLSSLETLDLRQNNLNTLPTELGLLGLKTLLIAGNPLRKIPEEFKQGKTKELLEYLKSSASGSTSCYRMKLMIVGQENVGKTSLLRCFRQQRSILPLRRVKSKTKGNITLQNVATDGIEIHDWSEPTDQADEDGNKITVNFNTWDFAGQDVYYTTHQFFLSRRSIYLIAFNLLDDNYSRIAYWLKSILSRVKDAPIMLVGTHADDKRCTQPYIEGVQKHLYNLFCTQYHSIFGLYSLSTTTTQGVQEVKQRLVVEALKQPHMGEKFPNSYTLLEGLIIASREVRTPPVATFTEFEEMALRCGISNDAIPHACSFLNDMGIIVHCNDEKDSKLHDLVILNPSFITSAMASIVSLKNSMVKNGILEVSSWAFIWRAPDFPEFIHEPLIKLLETFEVLHHFKDKKKSLIPGLLGVDRPPIYDVWSKFPVSSEKSYGRIYNFDFLPIGFFSRAMTRLLHISEPIVYWQNGVIVQSESTKAFLEYIPTLQQIKYEVRGVSPTKLLRLIVEMMNSLIEGWFDEDVKIEKYVVCTHCTQARLFDTYLFDLDSCIRAFAERHAYMYCNGYRPVQLSQLVPDITLADLPQIDFSTITVVKELGKGGFGVVSKGIWNDEFVAIKQLILDSDEPEKSNPLSKFNDLASEAWYMSCLQHQNIVQLKGVCLDPFSIITEFVPYGDLYHLLADQSAPFERPLAFRVAVDIAQGMRFLQSVFPPIIHRDLKSPNILIAGLSPTDPVVAKVADFGLSMIVTSNLRGGGDTFSDWQSPEVQNQMDYTEKADVYSYGIILWELIARQKPFQEYDGQFRNAWRKRKEVTEGLRPTMPEGCPPQYQKLIVDCWQTAPEPRPSFDQILTRLFLLEAEFVGKNSSGAFIYTQQAMPSPTSTKLTRSSSSGSEREKPLDDIPNLKEAESFLQILTNPSSTHHNSLANEFLPRHCLIATRDHVWQGCTDGTINVWSIKSRTLIESFKKHSGFITTLEKIDQDIYSASKDGALCHWDSEKIKFKRTVKVKDVIRSIASSGSLLLCVAQKTILMFKMGARFKLEKEHRTEWPPTTILPYGNYVWIGHENGIISIWNIENLKMADTLHSHTKAVTCLKIAHQRIWSSSLDQKVCIWNAESGEFLDELKFEAEVLTLHVSRSYVYSGTLNNHIYVWNKKTHELVSKFKNSTSTQEGVDSITVIHENCTNIVQVWCIASLFHTTQFRSALSIWLVRDPAVPVLSSFNSTTFPNWPITPINRWVFASHTGPDDGIYSIFNRPEKDPTYNPRAYGKSVSTLDCQPKSNERTGDPNADCFFVKMFSNASIIGVADGDNWGIKARIAAQAVLGAAALHLENSLDKMTSVHAVAKLLEECFPIGKEAILKNAGGATNLLIGVVVNLEHQSPTRPFWAFICASLGDNKAFCWSFRTAKITEITDFSLSMGSGILGDVTYEANTQPEFYFFPCEEGDIIFLTTDGVHYNLDPEILHTNPKVLGLSSDNWSDVKREDPTYLLKLKREFCESFTSEVIGSFSRTTAQEVTEKLINFCIEVTAEKKKAMEEMSAIQWNEIRREEVKKLQREARLKVKGLRGKLDHTTCVSVIVAVIPISNFKAASSVCNNNNGNSNNNINRENSFHRKSHNSFNQKLNSASSRKDFLGQTRKV